MSQYLGTDLSMTDLRKAVKKYAYLLDFLDVVSTSIPPIRTTWMAKKLGTPASLVSRYVRWIRSKNVKLGVKYFPSAIGLGTIVALVKDLARAIPRNHWLVFKTESGMGTMLMYRYPFVKEPSFITDLLKKSAKDSVSVWLYDYEIPPSPSLKVYWINDGLANPNEALNIALEKHPKINTYVVKGTKPRDVFDLILLLILEENALLSFSEIVDYLSQFGVRSPKKRINTHLKHLLEDNVIAGIRHLMVSGSSTIMTFHVEFGSNRDLIEAVDFFSRYLYTVNILRNDYDAMFSIRASIRYAPFIRRMLTEVLRAEHIVFNPYSIENTETKKLLLFRNYNPYEKTWVCEPSELSLPAPGMKLALYMLISWELGKSINELLVSNPSKIIDHVRKLFPNMSEETIYMLLGGK